MQVALGVERAAVLRAEVAVRIEDVLGRHLVVAAHQRHALHRDLAGGAGRRARAPDRGIDDAQRHARERAAAGLLAQLERRVGGEHGGDREGLGEAVGGAGAVLVLLDSGELRDRRAEVDLAHAAQIALARRGVLAQRLLLVRPGVHGRRALALDQRERGARLEDLLEQQRRAHRERGADRHRDAGRPEERIGGVDAILRLEAQDLGEAPALEDRRALRVQHALRLRGGAGGVDQQAVVAGLDLGDGGVEQRVAHALLVREQLPPGLDAAARRVDARHATRRSCGKSRQRSRPGAPERDRGVLGEQVLEEAVLLAGPAASAAPTRRCVAART